MFTVSLAPFGIPVSRSQHTYTRVMNGQKKLRRTYVHWPDISPLTSKLVNEFHLTWTILSSSLCFLEHFSLELGAGIGPTDRRTDRRTDGQTDRHGFNA